MKCLLLNDPLYSINVQRTNVDLHEGTHLYTEVDIAIALSIVVLTFALTHIVILDMSGYVTCRVASL